MSTNNTEKTKNELSKSKPELDANQVSKWLDAHPEFLNEYLRKLQIQRRSLILSDKNALLLANFNRSNASSKRQDSKNAISSSLPNNQTVFLSKKSNFYYTNNPLISRMPLICKSLNSSYSEPNIPPATNIASNSTHLLLKNRKHFKQLSLHEKMYTLVKTLYQSLDLKLTCKKILNTVSLLLDADRCSLFLVADDELSTEETNKKCLISVVFDAKSKNEMKNQRNDCDEKEEDNDNEIIKIPYGKGIAGCVASTGKSLNIPDAYKDPRFNRSIDQQTGYKTKSILCLPILNENGQCIAVAEAINKLSDQAKDNGDDEDDEDDDTQVVYSSKTDESTQYFHFTNEDESIFEKFMPFIAIAIRNSNLYTQSRKEAQTNKVLLELATIVFDESSTTVDNLVSRILFNSIYLLECERCQVLLLKNNSANNSLNDLLAATSSHRPPSLNSNINKYFDRMYELNYNELAQNENASNGIGVKPSKPNFPEHSCLVDIITHVIKSGDILNITSLSEHEKYAELADNTKNLLSIPVMNGSGHVVALIFAFNKIKNPSSESFFSLSDVNIAQAFALFCGIGLQNIMMYEKIVRAMNMKQVALEVLSYHVSSSQEEVDRLASETIPSPIDLDLHLFTFDENTLDDTGTLKACISMFSDLGLVEKFNIPYEIMCRFFLTVKKNYRPVAYHNWRHGFNVMSCMYTVLTTGKYRNVFDDLEIFSLLIACICHDLDHRGTTNNFQIKTQSPLAKLYTTSTMEHHHFNQCIIILHNNMNNILMNLTPAQHSAAIEIIEKAILATDLALHFKHFDRFLEKANSKRRDFRTHEEKDLLMHMLMTACDLSGATKPWTCHHRLSILVSNEFFNEGDLEKEKFNKEPIDSMNRSKSDQLPQMQIQFLQSVCLPLYQGLFQCNPVLKPLVDACESNVSEWKKLAKS